MRSDERVLKPRAPTASGDRNWYRDHLLSIVLLGLFLASLIGQVYFQYRHEVDEALAHAQPAPDWISGKFMNSFWASVLENWQSEFLQLASFVILATYFIHRGSPQSREGSDELKEDVKAIKRKLGV